MYGWSKFLSISDGDLADAMSMALGKLGGKCNGSIKFKTNKVLWLYQF